MILQVWTTFLSPQGMNAVLEVYSYANTFIGLKMNEEWILACSHPWPDPKQDDASVSFHPLFNMLAKGLSMNSDCGRDETQF